MRQPFFLAFALQLTSCLVQTEGVTAERGLPGQDGADGADGTPGQDGEDGATGKDGIDGKPGADGVSPFSYTNDMMTDIYYSNGKVGIGTDQPEAALHVVGDTKIGNALLLGISGGPSCSTASCTSKIASDGGYSVNYNGMWIGSNEQPDGTQSNGSLPSWAVDIGGVDNLLFPDSKDTFNILRRPPGGDFARLLTVTSGGAFGIGTTTPQAKLEVADSAGDASIRITSAAGLTPSLEFYQGDGIYRASIDANAYGLIIDGSVGIGTTTPLATLDINGTTRLAKFASPPVPCDAAHDAIIYLTLDYVTCVCKSASAQWVRTADGMTPC